MLDVTVICVGGLKEKFWKDACAEYIKRLTPWARASVIEIPAERLPGRPGEAEIRRALEREGEKITAAVPKGAFVTALCVEGRQPDSEAFSALVAARMQTAGRLAFIIGGSYGLDERVKKAAGDRLSLSNMTFPHMTARVLLLEQLYRALSIINGGKYHK
jgi:23S rRNA (pseudouridine1915-N3)-methyltransferase